MYALWTRIDERAGERWLERDFFLQQTVAEQQACNIDPLSLAGWTNLERVIGANAAMANFIEKIITLNIILLAQVEYPLVKMKPKKEKVRSSYQRVWTQMTHLYGLTQTAFTPAQTAYDEQPYAAYKI